MTTNVSNLFSKNWKNFWSPVCKFLAGKLSLKSLIRVILHVSTEQGTTSVQIMLFWYIQGLKYNAGFETAMGDFFSPKYYKEVSNTTIVQISILPLISSMWTDDKVSPFLYLKSSASWRSLSRTILKPDCQVVWSHICLRQCSPSSNGNIILHAEVIHHLFRFVALNDTGESCTSELIRENFKEKF